MAYTVQNAIDRFALTYGQASTALRLALFLETYWEVLIQCQVEQDVESFNLTAGTREYEMDYDPRMVNVRCVVLVESSTSFTHLVPRSTDWLDKNVHGWRNTTDRGTPDSFYIEAVDSAAVTTEGKIVLGLDPIPDTTTSGGYPVVKVYGTVYEILAATDKIPAIFPNVEVFAAGMRAKYAGARDASRAAMFEEQYSRWTHKTLAAINGLVEDADHPRIVPDWLENAPVQ